jgi:hypothetical protein
METFTASFLDESLIGIDSPKNILFHWRFTRTKQSRCWCFTRQTRRIFNGEILKKQNIYAIYQRKPEKVGIIATLIGIQVIILDEPFAKTQPHNSD